MPVIERCIQALFALVQPVMGRGMSGNVRGFNKTAADGTSGSGTLSCPLSKTKTGHIPQGQSDEWMEHARDIFAWCTSESGRAGATASLAKNSFLTTCLVIYFSL